MAGVPGSNDVSSTVDTVDSVDTVVMSLCRYCRYCRYASSCVVIPSLQHKGVPSLSSRVVVSLLSLCLHATIVVIVVAVVTCRHVSSRVVTCRYASLCVVSVVSVVSVVVVLIVLVVLV